MKPIDHQSDAPAIILFGSPGSGKGTQSRFLQATLRIPHISTGDMLRKHIEACDEIGKESDRLIRTGRLVPDELVNGLVEERLQEPDTRRGVIFDGYPRTTNQAGVLLGFARSFHFRVGVIHLEVDYDKIVARLTGRRLCPQCGTLYSLTTNPPKMSGICDLDGTPLITREDDREEVIRERLGQYESQTRPLLNFFEQKGVPMLAIAADAPPEVISGRVMDALQAEHLVSGVNEVETTARPRM